MTDSDGAANANNLAGTDGSFVVAKHAFRTDDVSFVNGSNMAELGAIKEGTGAIMRTDDGSLDVACYAKHAFENGSNMVDLRVIKEANANHLAGTPDINIIRTGGSCSNMVDLRVIKEGLLLGSYSCCTVKELPTMRLDVVWGENEKRFGKITLDLSQKAEKGITSGKIKRLENMATSIQLQKRFEILKNKRGSMESLPLDIVQDIASRVPAKSVFECKLVCKNWGTLVRGSNFISMHLSRQLNHIHGGNDNNDNIAAKVESCLFFACRIGNPGAYKTLLFHGGQPSDRIGNDEEYIYHENLKRIYHPPMHNRPLFNHLVGSCNGLVCTLQPHHVVLDPIYICNPLTREYVYLPELVVRKEDVDPGFLLLVRGEVNMHGNIASGFGYVRSTNEYKVVRIHYLQYQVGNVEVYTLGSGRGWREVGRVPYRLDTMSGGTGTYANDAIYWTSTRKVVTFDLAKEEFRLLPVPPCMQNRRNSDRCGLVTLGGRLCLYMGTLRVEIWSLMKSCDSKETWCLMFDIDCEAIVGSGEMMFQPILLTRREEIIFLYAKSLLYCYDTKTALLRMISDEASTDNLKAVEAIAHVNTFASLEAIGEISKRYTVRTPSDDVTDVLDRVAFGEEIDTTGFSFG